MKKKLNLRVELKTDKEKLEDAFSTAVKTSVKAGAFAYPNNPPKCGCCVRG